MQSGKSVNCAISMARSERVMLASDTRALKDIDDTQLMEALIHIGSRLQISTLMPLYMLALKR